MPGSVVVHTLSGAKKAREVCRLVEALYLAGKRVVVFLDDAGRATILDDMLWTFSPEAFVPHVLWDGGEVEEPVAIVAGRLANPNRATVLVVAGALQPSAEVAAFEEIHDVVAQVAEDSGKVEAWRQAGFAVREVRGVP